MSRFRLRNLSLRARLVLGIVALLAAGLTVADITAIALLGNYQEQRIDQQLQGPGGSVPAQYMPNGVSEMCRVLTAAAQGSQQLPTAFNLTVVDSQGQVLCRLPATPSPLGSPDLSGLGIGSTDPTGGEPRTVRDVDGKAPWRLRVVTTTDGHAVIAISLAENIDTLRRLQLVMTGASAVILLLAGIGSWALVRLGLRPLTEIEDTADAIAKGDLSQRVKELPPTTEIGRLANSLNVMLTQIEQGFDERIKTEERLRQFLADASHELRTPLATIRGHAEMYRHGMATRPDDVAVLLGRIESESIRMGDLVHDLLLLARLDTSPGLHLQPVDLLSVAADAVLDARARDPLRHIGLTRLTGDGFRDLPPVVTGDEARIRQVLGNLISNVLRYTPAGSPFEITIGVRASGVQLLVIDHGPGLGEAAAERIFERFYRDDYGRGRSSGGAGLGLSIVSSLMAAHGGTVVCRATPGGGATFALEFTTGAAGALPGGSTAQ